VAGLFSFDTIKLKQMITIYTDGSSRGNPGPGGWGAVVMSDNNSQPTTDNKQWVRELGGREGHTTNNRMELTAAIKSLEFVFSPEVEVGESEVVVYTDSEYVMKGITLWVHGWQKKGWRTAAKKPVLNQDLWQELLQVTSGKQIVWKYVAGHTGVDLNERADVIATSFADNTLPTLYDGSMEKYQ